MTTVKLEFDEKEFEKLLNLTDEIDEALIDEMNLLGESMVTESKNNTNVITSLLKKSWMLEEAKKVDGYIEVGIYNNTEYAEYVEYGHRQEVGRYVPALGKRLVKPYVEGQYIMTNATLNAVKKLDDVVKNALERVESNFK